MMYKNLEFSEEQRTRNKLSLLEKTLFAGKVGVFSTSLTASILLLSVGANFLKEDNFKKGAIYLGIGIISGLIAMYIGYKTKENQQKYK